MPDYHDGKGTSIVLIHSEKGCKIWADIETQIQSREVDIAHCMDENVAAIQPAEMPEMRGPFMQRYREADFNALVAELLPPKSQARTPSLFYRVLQRLRQALRN